MPEKLRLAATAALVLALGLGPALAGAQDSRTFDYRASEEWADSTVTLLPGDRVVVDTQASWANSSPGSAKFGARGFPGGPTYPGTYRPDLPLGMALVRVGDATWPAVDHTLDIRQPGRLRFAMNDVPGTYGDNVGSARVLIRLFLQPAVMKDFRGKSTDELREFLSRWGLQPEIRGGESQSDAGLIIAQAPMQGIDLHEVAQVVVQIAEPPPPPLSPAPVPPPPPPIPVPGSDIPDARVAMVRVPDIVGYDGAEGEMRLRDAGLKPRSAGSRLSPLAAGTILDSTPQAGASVPRGTQVRYARASGTNTLPDVARLTAAEAREILNAAGFHDVDLQRPLLGGATVALQTPLAGLVVPLDTRIMLTLAGGVTTRVLPGVLIVGALGGATQLWRRWRRRVYTAGIQVHATLSGGSRTRVCDAPVPLSLALHCRVASTATNFRKQPVIVNTEATHA